MDFEFILLSPPLVWSTRPSWAIWHTYAPTFNKRHKKKKKKKVSLHRLTHGVMRVWVELFGGLVCTNDPKKICDIRKRNVTIRSQ